MASQIRGSLPAAPLSGSRASEMILALKRVGLRITPQRLAICRALSERRNHPTAQDLYARLHPDFPSLSRATVYNTLQVLIEAGLISEMGPAGDGAVHYDGDPAPHVNLVCLRCHRVEDFPHPALGQVHRQVALESGYQLQGARIAYYGLCPRCRGR